MPALALQVAVAGGQSEALELLLAAGVNLRANDELALRLAVACCRPAAIKMLLELGANWRRLGGKLGGPDLRKVFAEHAERRGDCELTAALV